MKNMMKIGERKVELDRDGEGDSEALIIGYCSINVCDASELELA